MRPKTLFLTLILILFPALYLWFAPPPYTPTESEAGIQVVVDGLIAPIGMAVLPDGGLLVAEDGTGKRDDSSGISLITSNGQVGRLVSGFSSTRDSGDLAGAPLVALSPAGDKIYIGHYGDGHLWTLPLTPEEQTNGLKLPSTPLTTDDLTPEMLPLNNVRLQNPFDLVFDPDGFPVVTDSTGDGVAKKNPDGTTRFIHRFPRMDNLATELESDQISPVPTGITRVGDEYYVTLTAGCPYPTGSGKVVAIDEERNQRTVVDGLNMPIDVAQGPDGTIWVLEFARFTQGMDCFGLDGMPYQARTGRLSRLTPEGELETVLTKLNFPGAVLPMPDGSLYLSEIFPGRILRITFDGRSARKNAEKRPLISVSDERSPPDSIPPDDYDQALQSVLQARNLHPAPGKNIREADTRLAQLGQALFFDPILSGDQNTSCATCHHPQLAMADARALPIGTGGAGLGPYRQFLETVVLGPDADSNRRQAGVTDPKTGLTTVGNPFVGEFIPRNSPTIINAALYPTQFWDSRVESASLGEQVQTQEGAVNHMALTDPVATQALFPMTSLTEMAGSTYSELAPQTMRLKLVDRLRQIPAYIAHFQQVFGPLGDTPEAAITVERVAIAIAAFERRFIFTQSPWDEYLAGETNALTKQQKHGALLFYGQSKPQVNCVACHSGDLFTDFKHHNLLSPQLGPGKGHDYTGREDWGRAGVTFDFRDRYAFRTPSLRNVTLTAPYFHDGAFATLADAIRHHADVWRSAETYDPSANQVPPSLYSSLRAFNAQKQGQTVAPELAQKLPLTEDDIADLVAFLESLTDPAAHDLSAFLPTRVPSGLPMDPLLTPEQLAELAETKAIAITQPLPDDDAPAQLSVGFYMQNVAQQVGLDFRHQAFETAIFEDPAAAMGGGLCWIDYNNDGWLDLYLLNSYAEEEKDYWMSKGGLPHNALFRNNGGIFSDVSVESGSDLSMRGTGCAAADLDGDGWTDLFVTADGVNALLWNNGDGTFTEGAAAAGVDAPEWNSSAVVGDLNGDALPDMFVGAFIDLEKKIPKPIGAFPQDYYGLPDHLYLNQGAASPGNKPTFRDVAQLVGLHREERALGSILSDLDLDGDLDLYIANDGHPNRLYANQPTPGGLAADPEGLGFRFADLVETANVGDSGSGMGVAGGDYNGDGWFDLFVTNWEREVSALYRNEIGDKGELTFLYSTYRIGVSGLGNDMTSWGTAWADLDHDTDLDLFVVNGRVPITNLDADPQLARFYRNRDQNLSGKPGQPGRFIEWTGQVGLKEVGPMLARGAVLADYDNDGDLDVAVNIIANNPALLQTTNVEGNWLIVNLGGVYPGAIVVVTLPDGRKLSREVHIGSGFLSTEDPRPHFGLGNFDRAASLDIHLPGGQALHFEDVPANQIFQVDSLAPLSRKAPQVGGLGG